MLMIYLLLSFTAPYAGVADASTSSPSLSFELDMSLGSEDGEDHLLFSATTFFSVGPNGQIAILDAGNKRVLLFGHDGKFQGTAGREGEGPGEFSSPSEIAHDQKGNIYVFDAQALRVNVFSESGAYLKVLRMPNGIVGLIQPTLLPNGNIVLSNVKLDQNNQQTYFLSLFSPEMELIKQLDSQPQPVLDWSQSGTSEFWVDFLVGHLEGLGRGVPLSTVSGDGFVTVLSNQYAGSLWRSNGEQYAQFARKSRPIIMSEEMKQDQCESAYQKVSASGEVARFIPYGVYQRAMRKAVLPETISPISQLFSTETGFGVLVSYDTVKKQGRIELFDQQGNYQRGGEFTGLASSMRWFQGKLYTMGETEDGLQVLNRYKVKDAPAIH